MQRKSEKLRTPCCLHARHLWTFRPQSRLSAKLFLQSSELGLPHPTTRRRACPPPPLNRGEGHTRWREKGWESPNSDEGTYTVVLFIYKYRTLCFRLLNSYPENLLLLEAVSAIFEFRLLNSYPENLFSTTSSSVRRYRLWSFGGFENFFFLHFSFDSCLKCYEVNSVKRKIVAFVNSTDFLTSRCM